MGWKEPGWAWNLKCLIFILLFSLVKMHCLNYSQLLLFVDEFSNRQKIQDAGKCHSMLPDKAVLAVRIERIHLNTSCLLMLSGGLLLWGKAVELKSCCSQRLQAVSVLVLKGWICCSSLGFPFANGGAYFPFTFDSFDLLMECKLFSKSLKQLGCGAAQGKSANISGRNPTISTLQIQLVDEWPFCLSL